MYSLTLTERIMLSNLFALYILFGISLVVCLVLTNLLCSTVYASHVNTNSNIYHTPYLSGYTFASFAQTLMILLLVIQFVFGNPENKEKRMLIAKEVVLNSNQMGLNLVAEVVAHSKNTKIIVALNSYDEVEQATKVLKDTQLFDVLEKFLIFDKELSSRDNIVVLSQESTLNFLEHCNVIVLSNEDRELSEHLTTYNVCSETAAGRELYLKLHNMQANKGPFKFHKIVLNRPRSTEGYKCSVATIGGTVVKQKKGEKHGDT